MGTLRTVEIDLEGAKDGISERFVPDRDRERLIEVEHLARYRWAAALAAGRTVLDAGCGTAYGSRMLSEAGAREVVGVDRAESVLNEVGPTMPDNVTLQVGDLRALELEDDRFDLIVCFEVIEHVPDPSTVLDELTRVLAPDGVLLISSPNRGVYQPDNPHHIHEFTAEELAGELAARLPNVRLLRQHDYLVSAILGDDANAVGGDTEVDGVELRKLIADRPDTETYTLAIAGTGPEPAVGQLAMMTGTFELAEWISAADAQSRAIDARDRELAELRERLGERERLADLLTAAEQRLSQIPDLNVRIAALEGELSLARADAEVARTQARELDQMLMYGRRMLRHVRPLIVPLRRLRRMLRS